MLADNNKKPASIFMDVNWQCTIAYRDYIAACSAAAATVLSVNTNPSSKIAVSISQCDEKTWENRVQVKQYKLPFKSYPI